MSENCPDKECPSNECEITQNFEKCSWYRRYQAGIEQGVLIEREEMKSKREQLADYAHRAWSGWMKWLFSRSEENIDNTVIVPATLVQHWKRQIDTDYKDLSKMEKESDLKEADEILAIISDKQEENFNEV